eukprot:scaffold2064_cov29-Attheya_sp.AAC.1
MDPIQRFLDDVCTDIAVWKLEGDQVVLMGDFNEDVRTEPLKESMFAKLSMREIIMSVNDPTKAPGTFNRGSTPIDGMWATFHLEPIRAGYTDLAHGFGGDHRIGCADFTYENIFGHLLPAIERPIARRLRLGDPRVVAKFCDLREEHAQRLQLATRTIRNEQQACYPPSQQNNVCHELNDKDLVAGIWYADKHCRKIRRGALPWSPQLSNAQIRLKLIESLLKRRRHVTISSRNIRRMENKLGEFDLHDLDEKSLLTELRRAQADYRSIGDGADEHRRHFLQDLAQARTEANNTKGETELHNLLKCEEQRRIAARIRSVSGRAPRPILTRLLKKQQNQKI